VSAFSYPDSDAFLDAALQRGEREPQTFVAVSRPWQTAADTLDVRYLASLDDNKQLDAEIDGMRIPLDQPVKLLPVTINKPWGHETWHSGMEARGESSVQAECGTLPLLSYLSLAPRRLCGRRPPVLLKTLTSRPEPVAGELYFEIHEHKQEVYVVSEVDERVYPDNVGAIRFGMNQAMRTRYDSDEGFRQAFLAAVRNYEQESPGLTARSTSSDHRNQMLSFINLEPLRRGDALVVPSGVPHSLQAGLTVIEFQTPSYERQIIYASQPVLTQAHWDSLSAIANMSLEPPAAPLPEAHPDPVIASFPEFGVRRIRLEATTAQPLPPGLPYAVCMATTDNISIACARSSLSLAKGQAAFIPGSAQQVTFSAPQPAQLLLSGPGL
jgi:hypothetical protein